LILSRESRWLRLGGMGLMAASMLAFGFLGHAADTSQVLRSGDKSMAAWFAFLFLLAVNLFTLGLVLLLAGLRQLSLRASAHARRGVLARVGAVNLMLLGVASLALGAWAQDNDNLFIQWSFVPILVVFVLVARASVLRFRAGWKYDVRTAEEVVAADPRRPVLYLRSFGVDDQVQVPTRGGWARLMALSNYAASVSPEQELTFMLERIGPVVAIGRPGERLPELGAARLYVGDDDWRRVVGEFMDNAALVVIRAGETANLWWETEEALAPVLVRTSHDRGARARRAPSRPSSGASRRRSASRPRRRRCPAHGCSRPCSRCCFRTETATGRSSTSIGIPGRTKEPLVFRLTWSGVVLSSFRPYRDSLQAALRTVFGKLGLRWVAKRSQTVAVLLALFGGIVGLHHFYTGTSPAEASGISRSSGWRFRWSSAGSTACGSRCWTTPSSRRG
jgi:hypothetical protein